MNILIWNQWIFISRHIYCIDNLSRNSISILRSINRHYLTLPKIVVSETHWFLPIHLETSFQVLKFVDVCLGIGDVVTIEILVVIVIAISIIINATAASSQLVEI